MELKDKFNRNLLIYILKCLAACVVAFCLTYYFAYTDTNWFMLSSLLVLSPAGEEALPFTMDRIKANLIGSFSSFLILVAGFTGEAGILMGVTLSIILCSLSGLMGVSRPALAAVIIVMMHPAGAHLWDTVAMRVIAVVGGCFSGLAITYIFHLGRIHKKKIDAEKAEAAKAQQEA